MSPLTRPSGRRSSETTTRSPPRAVHRTRPAPISGMESRATSTKPRTPPRSSSEVGGPADRAFVAAGGTPGRSDLDEPQEVLLDALEFVRAAGPRFEDGLERRLDRAEDILHARLEPLRVGTSGEHDEDRMEAVHHPDAVVAVLQFLQRAVLRPQGIRDEIPNGHEHSARD